MSDVRLLYVTASDREEAERVATSVVTERLAACVNVLGSIQSVYMWKGKLENGSEVALLIKTTEAMVPQVIERVKSLHSYDCPAILVLPVLGGNQDFLQWVQSECRQSRGV